MDGVKSRVKSSIERWLLLLCLFLSMGRLSLRADGAISLSSEAQLSLLIASPIEDEVYTIYGHAAIRIYDPKEQLDWTFNYGIFSFSDDFVWRFTLGQTDYRVAVEETPSYLISYRNRGSDVCELILDLSPDEKQRIWEYLLWNIKPENAVYRYNFFYDNCSTRPIEIIKELTGGSLMLPNEIQPYSWRQIVQDVEKNKPWLRWGTDLALGAPNDEKPTLEQTFFLPSYVERYLPHTRLHRPDGSMRALVQETKIYPATILKPQPRQSLLDKALDPLYITLLILVLTAFSFRHSFRHGRGYLWGAMLHLLLGLIGVVLCFLMFCTEHPQVSPNYLLWPFSPIYLVVGLPLIFKRSWPWVRFWYHFVIFVSLVVFLISLGYLPQQFDLPSLILVVAMEVEALRVVLIGYIRYRRSRDVSQLL